MISIVENYYFLVQKFQAIEKGSGTDEIHDKRVILRRIFPLLSVYGIKPSKVKNGEKAFKLFGKLRDIQVQLEKLKKSSLTVELTEYRFFLKKQETKLQAKVQKFSKNKEIMFPKPDKKQLIDKVKLASKANKQLQKLVEKIQSLAIADASDIHVLRIEFKKYRYLVEILALVENIDEEKINILKTYQDLLGEIQDYEVLMNGIKAYCKRKKLPDIDIDGLIDKQNSLIETFENQTEKFVDVCMNVLEYKA